eukprot:Skav212239  [mRNA]  locus=scaffold4106:82972:86749:+ [translate_table: standard]
MEAPRDSCNAWLGLASSCMSDSLWELIVKSPEASLSHRACPWGGHLVKFDCRNVFIQEAPKDPAHVLVRPEVRDSGTQHAEIRVRCQKVHAPGDALLDMWVMRMGKILFGHCCSDEGQDGSANFFDLDTTCKTRHQIRRNFPEHGDCSYVGQGCLWMSRPEVGSGNRFRVILVVRTPDEKRFAPWASLLFSMIRPWTE